MIAVDGRFRIGSEMEVTLAVLEVARRCELAGFDATASRKIATAASELARNILKYAGRGELRLRAIEELGRRGVQIDSLDDGPGIADIEAALRDQFSTGGTLGLGLPGVRRLMDDFDIASSPGRGTRVTVRKWL